MNTNNNKTIIKDRCEDCGRGAGRFCCKFVDEFIIKDLEELRKSKEGLEMLKWRVLYWKTRWGTWIESCGNCQIHMDENKELKEFWDEEKKILEGLRNV